MDRNKILTKPAPSVLRTMGQPTLTGCCVVTLGAQKRKHVDESESVDGKFTCADAASVAELHASGWRSLLEASDGTSYIISLLDSDGSFHVLRSFTRLSFAAN